MLENITSAVTGLLTLLGNVINPSLAGDNAVAPAYAAAFALPVLAGVMAFVVRMVRKAR